MDWGIILVRHVKLLLEKPVHPPLTIRSFPVSPLSDDPLSVCIASLRSRALTVHISVSEEHDASPSVKQVLRYIVSQFLRVKGTSELCPLLGDSQAVNEVLSKWYSFLGRGVPLQTCMIVVRISFWWLWTEVLVSLLTVGSDCQLEVTQWSLPQVFVSAWQFSFPDLFFLTAPLHHSLACLFFLVIPFRCILSFFILFSLSFYFFLSLFISGLHSGQFFSYLFHR